MSEDIILKLSPKTARHLSYCIGRSDEANAVAGAATQAAKSAEKNVRDMLVMIADQDGQKLPENFALTFDEDSSVVTIVEHQPVEYNAPPQTSVLNVNGVREH